MVAKKKAVHNKQLFLCGYNNQFLHFFIWAQKRKGRKRQREVAKKVEKDGDEVIK